MTKIAQDHESRLAILQYTAKQRLPLELCIRCQNWRIDQIIRSPDSPNHANHMLFDCLAPDSRSRLISDATKGPIGQVGQKEQYYRRQPIAARHASKLWDAPQVSS